MKIFTQIILQVVLIALNAIFACAEIAVLSTNDAKISALEAKGNKRAKRLNKLKDNPARFLATIQVAITLSGFLGSAFASDSFAEPLVKLVMQTGIGVPESTVKTIAVVIITFILSFFTLVFGELVPKRVAMKNPEKISLFLSSTISFIATVFAPLVKLLTVSTNGVLRLLGINPEESEEEVTEDEIRLLVDQGSESGTIDTDEKELIDNVFEFDDITANGIATHRKEITILWTDETLEEWDETIRASSHSFFPICDDNVDNVVGVLSAKDYFRLDDKSLESVMKKAVKEPYFVPETVPANQLFKNMKKDRSFFAVVVDEYGGMSGIVTITDLLECIVGDIFDEDEKTKVPDILQIDENTWEIQGSAPIMDVEKALDIELDCDSDTFAGYTLAYVGSIPDDGTVLTVSSELLSINITKIIDHRIESTIVTKLNPPKEDEEEDKDNEKDE